MTCERACECLTLGQVPASLLLQISMTENMTMRKKMKMTRVKKTMFRKMIMVAKIMKDKQPVLPVVPFPTHRMPLTMKLMPSLILATLVLILVALVEVADLVGFAFS